MSYFFTGKNAIPPWVEKTVCQALIEYEQPADAAELGQVISVEPLLVSDGKACINVDIMSRDVVKNRGSVVRVQINKVFFKKETEMLTILAEGVKVLGAGNLQCVGQPQPVHECIEVRRALGELTDEQLANVGRNLPLGDVASLFRISEDEQETRERELPLGNVRELYEDESFSQLENFPLGSAPVEKPIEERIVCAPGGSPLIARRQPRLAGKMSKEPTTPQRKSGLAMLKPNQLHELIDGVNLAAKQQEAENRQHQESMRQALESYVEPRQTRANVNAEDEESSESCDTDTEEDLAISKMLVTEDESTETGADDPDTQPSRTAKKRTSTPNTKATTELYTSTTRAVETNRLPGGSSSNTKDAMPIIDETKTQSFQTQPLLTQNNDTPRRDETQHFQTQAFAQKSPPRSVTRENVESAGVSESQTSGLHQQVEFQTQLDASLPTPATRNPRKPAPAVAASNKETTLKSPLMRKRKAAALTRILSNANTTTSNTQSTNESNPRKRRPLRRAGDALRAFL